ncbi:MAG: TetR/AcrR family transcriptional regulator [Betaproteobacteria bacterium]
MRAPRKASRSDSNASGLAATRADIKEAAKRLIASQGFAATTMRQIARGASMEGGSLYYHFGGKDEILFTILEEGNRKLLEAAERVLRLKLKDAAAVLQRLIREHVCILAADPEQFMVVTRELHRLRGERRKRIMVQRDQYERLIQGVLRKGIEEGTIRPCDVKIVSYGLIAFLNGVAYWFDPHGRLTIEKIADEYGEVLLRGLQT